MNALNSLDYWIDDWILDKILMAKCWRTLSELMYLSNTDSEEKLLKLYRDALWEWRKIIKDTKQRVIVTLDGRDTAWKWSNIWRVTHDFKNDKYFKEKAFWIPTDIEKIDFNHFLKFVPYFPWEHWWVTLFDRSWYNRALVEAVMWFTSQEQYDWFFENVVDFEKKQISKKWIDLIKVYLSIPKHVQEERLMLRTQRPRKHHKMSPVDANALKFRDHYTFAKKNMLESTDTEVAPWHIIDSTNKNLSAIEIIKLIIKTSEEAVSVLWNRVNLEQESNIYREWSQELIRMDHNWDFESMSSELNFKELSEQEIQFLDKYRKNNRFNKRTYSYTPVK